MIREQLRPLIPPLLLKYYRIYRFKFNRWKYKGDNYYCNVCSSNLKSWVNAGPLSNRNLICPVCNSYGRHRMMAIVIEDEIAAKTTACDGLKILHFAPEIGLKNWIKTKFNRLDYKSTDLTSSEVDFRLNLHKITLDNESFDFIVISHVLEHVDNDVRAIGELSRILRTEGILFIQVPLSGEYKTIDRKLINAIDRSKQYGQSDHVRLYGLDLKDRLFEAGLDVVIHEANEKPYSDFFSYMALDLPRDSSMIYDTESTVFVCKKISGKN